jgi:hypothetical protein
MPTNVSSINSGKVVSQAEKPNVEATKIAFNSLYRTFKQLRSELEAKGFDCSVKFAEKTVRKAGKVKDCALKVIAQSVLDQAKGLNKPEHIENIMALVQSQGANSPEKERIGNALLGLIGLKVNSDVPPITAATNESLNTPPDSPPTKKLEKQDLYQGFINEFKSGLKSAIIAHPEAKVLDFITEGSPYFVARLYALIGQMGSITEDEIAGLAMEVVDSLYS